MVALCLLDPPWGLGQYLAPDLEQLPGRDWKQGSLSPDHRGLATPIASGGCGIGAFSVEGTGVLDTLRL